jgi:5-(carboxyamino)imidazole ribonucleotide synthase
VDTILPPAMLGVLGGGQLGAMFVAAARSMGYGTTVLDPDPHAPAGRAADVHVVAAYDDTDALDRLATTCAAVTIEFENPPAHALEHLARRTVVAPSADAVAIVQDRRTEKRFVHIAGVPVAPFAVIDGPTHLAAAAETVGFPAILKTARLGYDGKGQCTVHRADDLADAWASLGSVPCVLERRLTLDAEVSVIVARRADGSSVVYEPARNVHVDGILDVSTVPSGLALAPRAQSLAVRIADTLGYVGVLGVELFVVDDELVVNELAPRPHNSGHWTLDAARTSQFEQQVRALCGLPLGSPTMTAAGVAMVNLLGDLWAEGDPDWAASLADPEVSLHLYGKPTPRPGRKMGHLTVTSTTDEADAAERARRLRCEANDATGTEARAERADDDHRCGGRPGAGIP